ncbi:MAG: MFS transporter, partial [Thermomicrobiales bacterium]
PLATTIVVASAIGTIGSGNLADRYGRRAVIVGALILTVPVVILFAQFTGPIGFLTGALVGFLAASTGPLMLVMAQQLMAGRAGMASGLILGLGFVTGAIGVPVMGALSDAFGIPTAMRFQAVVVLVTIAVAFFLPSEEFLFNRTRAIEAASLPIPVASSE